MYAAFSSHLVAFVKQIHCRPIMTSSEFMLWDIEVKMSYLAMKTFATLIIFHEFNRALYKRRFYLVLMWRPRIVTHVFVMAIETMSLFSKAMYLGLFGIDFLQQGGFFSHRYFQVTNFTGSQDRGSLFLN